MESGREAFYNFHKQCVDGTVSTPVTLAHVRVGDVRRSPWCRRRSRRVAEMIALTAEIVWFFFHNIPLKLRFFFYLFCSGRGFGFNWPAELNFVCVGTEQRFISAESLVGSLLVWHVPALTPIKLTLHFSIVYSSKDRECKRGKCARIPAKGGVALCSRKEGKVTRAPPGRNPPWPPNPGDGWRENVNEIENDMK